MDSWEASLEHVDSPALIEPDRLIVSAGSDGYLVAGFGGVDRLLDGRIVSGNLYRRGRRNMALIEHVVSGP